MSPCAVFKFCNFRSSLKYLIHFAVIFVYGMRTKYYFILFVSKYPVSSAPFTENTMLSPLYIFGVLIKESDWAGEMAQWLRALAALPSD